MTTKESILEEFDKEINEDYLRGASSGSQLTGIKRFISQSLEKYGEEKYQEGFDAGHRAGHNEGAEDARIEDETKLINKFRD